MELLRQLQAEYQTLKHEQGALRAKLGAAEKDSFRKDRLLFELLASSRAGGGANAEMLEKVRQEILLLLRFKKRAFDLRAQVDQRHSTIAEIEAELKHTRVQEYEEELRKLRAQARALKARWAQEGSETSTFQQSRQWRTRYIEYDAALTEARNKSTDCFQKALQLKEDSEESRSQALKLDKQAQELEEKCCELERRTDQARAGIEELEHVEEIHRERTQRCDEITKQIRQYESDLAQIQRRRGDARARPRDPSGDAQVHPSFFDKNKPMCPPNGRVHHLLWRTRFALSSCNEWKGASLLEILAAFDENDDGVLTAAEVQRALHHLRVPQATPSAVNELLAQLPFAAQGKLPALDFVLWLERVGPPLPPCAGGLGVLKGYLQELADACQRKKISPEEIRQHLTSMAESPKGAAASEGSAFLISDLHMRGEAADAILECADALSVPVMCLHLPDWVVTDPEEDRCVLSRFFQSIVKQSERVEKAIASRGGPMHLRQFVNTALQWQPLDPADALDEWDLMQVVVLLQAEGSLRVGDRIDAMELLDFALTGRWKKLLPPLPAPAQP